MTTDTQGYDTEDRHEAELINTLIHLTTLLTEHEYMKSKNEWRMARLFNNTFARKELRGVHTAICELML